MAFGGAVTAFVGAASRHCPSQRANWLEVGRVDRGRIQLYVLLGSYLLCVLVHPSVRGRCGLKAFVWR